MGENTGSVNKLSGVWTQLDAILHRENRAHIWDNCDEFSKVAPKKKEKLKLRSKALLMCHPHVNGANKCILNKTKPVRGIEIFPSSSFQRLSRKKKDKCEKFKSNDKLSEKDSLESASRYINPLVECSFNLSRVSAQLERLMGTNVVRLTDRKYMMELRQRIHEDFNDMLAKRIENREVKEMERQRNLFMEGKITQCSGEYSNHPVFIMQQATIQSVPKRRYKLKTNRQKNAERLVRQGTKWEKERQKLIEIEKQRESEEKNRQTAALNMVIKFHGTNRDLGLELPRLRDSGSDSILDFKDFSDYYNEKTASQACKLAAKESRPNSVIDYDELQIEKSESVSNENDLSRLDDDDVRENVLTSKSGRTHTPIIGKIGADNVQYEDPMVSELKQTESVRDMYKLANEIICGKTNSESTISKESSTENNDDSSDN